MAIPYLWCAVPVIFLCYTVCILAIAKHPPQLETKSGDNMKYEVHFPRSFEELTDVANLLSHYKQLHLPYVLLLFCATYIYKQCFAIPGSVFMNVLAGALFGVTWGFPLVCLLTATGATGCYFLSRIFAKQYIEHFFPDRVRQMQITVKRNSDGLFFYLLFLRLFPMSPNWFLNIASPVLNIPVYYFYPSVFIGLMPYNFICVQSGSILSSLTSMSEMFTWMTMVKLLAVAIVALVPGIFLRKYQRRKQKRSELML